MGLIICITACCCGYCVYKKKKRSRLRATANENDIEPNGNIESGEQGNRGDIPEDGVAITMGEAANPGGNHPSNGTAMDGDYDRPPPYPHPGEARPIDDVSLRDTDEGAHTEQMSSKQIRYAHLNDSSNSNGEGHHNDEMTSDVAVKESKKDPTERHESQHDHMNDGATVFPEGDDTVDAGSRKNSSKKYKYSPLNPGGSAGPKEKRRLKSGESDSSSHHHSERDEIKMPLSPGDDSDDVVVPLSTYV